MTNRVAMITNWVVIFFYGTLLKVTPALYVTKVWIGLLFWGLYHNLSLLLVLVQERRFPHYPVQ